MRDVVLITLLKRLFSLSVAAKDVVIGIHMCLARYGNVAHNKLIHKMHLSTTVTTNKAIAITKTSLSMFIFLGLLSLKISFYSNCIFR